jgi:hypothetical protein
VASTAAAIVPLSPCRITGKAIDRPVVQLNDRVTRQLGASRSPRFEEVPLASADDLPMGTIENDGEGRHALVDDAPLSQQRPAIGTSRIPSSSRHCANDHHKEPSHPMW